jgi:branched-chain amino acid transport system substrate-binding protein
MIKDFVCENILSGCRALTKIQSIIIVAVIVVATVGGGVAYFLLSGGGQAEETIRIGVCADIDSSAGSAIWRGAVLAAEQINAEGGVLGRNFTIVAEDDDTETQPFDITVAINALTRLITVDKADFILNRGGFTSSVFQDLVVQHKKLLLSFGDPTEELTQRVLDDYDKYKYFFRVGVLNDTAATEGTVNSIVACRELTGFNKIAFIYHSLGTGSDMLSKTLDGLDQFGFEVVYTASVPLDTVDFSSYFAQAEAAGAEILYPVIVGPAGISFVKEYYDRQSPMVMWGLISAASSTNFWEVTEGKCEHTSIVGFPVVAGYPLTTKTVPTREAYLERWGEEINNGGAAAYDTARFILPDAIRRAGTIETEAVIAALEKTDIETSLARRFVFTSSHDIMMGEAEPNGSTEDYFSVFLFQWQEGVQVPVYPLKIMEEAGVTYTYPDWPGPWD